MKTASLLASLLFLSACASTQAEPKQDPMAAIAAAKSAQKQADALKGGWVTTDKLIKRAEKALAAGKKQEAAKLAEKALREAKLAKAQAEHEHARWSPPPYLR